MVTLFAQVAESCQVWSLPQETDEAAQRGRQPTHLDWLIALARAQDLLKGQPMTASLQVALIAGLLGKQLGLPGRSLTSLVYAALVRDAGLVYGAADLYRATQGRVGEKYYFRQVSRIAAGLIPPPQQELLHDWRQVQGLLQAHSQQAARLLDDLALSEDVSDLVVAHHELCDGSGYPLGLRAGMDGLTLEARVLAFADTLVEVMLDVSGLTSRRQAVEAFLEVKVDGRFDAGVVSAFRTLFEARGEYLTRLDQGDLAVELNALLPVRSRTLNGDMVLRMATAVGAWTDHLMPLYTAGHSLAVGKLAYQMAEKMEIPADQCGQLVVAALLSRLGMLGVPMAIAFKESPLQPEEWLAIRDYPRHTQMILSAVPGLETPARWCGEIHERMDGKGFPECRKGFEISAGGRLLAIVNACQALISPRPYRPHTYEPLDAMSILGQRRSTHYDNQLLGVLRNILYRQTIPADLRDTPV